MASILQEVHFNFKEDHAMKKSLEWLKARSRRIALNMEAVDIAKKAKSPTDAFNMAKQGSRYVRKNEVAEAVRYLAMIKRDYGKKELDAFVDGEDNRIIKGFLDKISIATTYLSILEASSDFGEGMRAVPDKIVALHFDKMISEIVADFEDQYLPQLDANVKNQGQCLRIFDECRLDIFHFHVMMNVVKDGKLENILALDSLLFEKVGMMLLNIGFALEDLYGIYFLGMKPLYYMQKYR